MYVVEVCFDALNHSHCQKDCCPICSTCDSARIPTKMRSQGLTKSSRDRNRRRAQSGDVSQGPDDDETENEQEKTVPNNKSVKSPSSGSSTAATTSSSRLAAAALPEDDRVWVQCNTCDKWRALPNTVDPAQLPDIWYCELNTFDEERNCCEVGPYLRARVVSVSTIPSLLQNCRRC